MISYQPIINIYRKYFESILPYPCLLFAYKIGAFPFLKKRIKELSSYYKELEKTVYLEPDIKEVIGYLSEDPFQLIPYRYVHEYLNRKVVVYKDYDCGMYFVVDDDKKLYFKKGMTKSEVLNCYNALSSEQDIYSPHRYLTSELKMFGVINRKKVIDNGFTVEKSDCVADCGTAEGNFSISIVDYVKKLYLFEYDKAWIKALEKSFKPYSDKVVIIEKKISSYDDKMHISLDGYFNNNLVSFYKMDLEGYEATALKNSYETLSKSSFRAAAVCVYHKYNLRNEILQLFLGHEYKVSFSPGYLHPWTITTGAPYFTRGVVRAIKG